MKPAVGWMLEAVPIGACPMYMPSELYRGTYKIGPGNIVIVETIGPT